MPVSRVPDAGSSNCQLSNDARISQKGADISKSMTETDYIILESIARRI